MKRNKEFFSIFGDPVAHSKSPIMHNSAFAGLGHPGCYGRYRLVEGERLRQAFLNLGLKGVNVTVPHKEHAYRACDELDPFARKVGAVNTIVLREGKLHGYNTDAPGFLEAIEPFGARSVLFLGAGGTAQATAEILREAGYEVTILNRSPGRLERFRERGFASYSWKEFSPGSYDLIVNMTSAGLKEESLPAPRELLDPLLEKAKGAVDVVYGRETPFLRLAGEKGLPRRDGSEMLLRQGVIAFGHFTDGRYDSREVERWMRRGLEL
ncbi:shikimate dehydrogenase [Nitratifractor sp.]